MVRGAFIVYKSLNFLYLCLNFNFIFLSLIIRLIKKTKSNIKKHGILYKNPQIKGNILKIRTMTPRKPNSARRAVGKVILSSNRTITAYIPGIGHNLHHHSSVLINGGGARDLPGIKFSCIRGVYDLSGVLNRKTRRSIYGVAQSKDLKVKLRRKFRVNL